MDFRFDAGNPYRRNSFGSVEGIIVEIMPARVNNRRADGCVLFVTVEDDNGDTNVFVLGPATYVVDWEVLEEGMRCTFWYRKDAPIPLIYPPRYNAVAVAQKHNDRTVEVGFFNSQLINEEMTLQLNLNERVDVRTVNNQYFLGSPSNHNLVVTYETSTRSIPAQTTPRSIVVLCDRAE